MKLGYHTGYWSAGPPAGVTDAIELAEKLGFDSIWTAEAYGSDCLTPLAWWGAATSTVRLGTNILQISARTPAATAMAAMTLDHLSGGRFILGIGASGPQVVEGWYGQPYPKPLARTREYIEVDPGDPGARRAGHPRRRVLPAALPRRHRPRQAAEVHGAPAARATSRSSSAPKGRRTSRSPPRSPTAGCRCSSRRRPTASTATRWPRASPGRARGARLADFEVPAFLPVVPTTTSRPRPTWCARRSRSTSAAWARSR